MNEWKVNEAKNKTGGKNAQIIKSNGRNEPSLWVSHGFDTVKLLVVDIELCAMLNLIEEKMNIKLNKMILEKKWREDDHIVVFGWVESISSFVFFFLILFKSLWKEKEKWGRKKRLKTMAIRLSFIIYNVKHWSATKTYSFRRCNYTMMCKFIVSMHQVIRVVKKCYYLNFSFLLSKSGCFIRNKMSCN